MSRKLSIRELFSIVLGTELGAAVSPTAIGGGYVKIGMLMHKGIEPGIAAFCITIGSLEDILFFVLAVTASLFFSDPIRAYLTEGIRGGPGWWQLAAPAAMLFICASLCLTNRRRIFSALYACSWFRRVSEKSRVALSEFVTAYGRIIKNGKLLFLVSFSLTAVQWICRYCVITVILAGFGVSVRPVVFFLLQVSVCLITLIAPTPGGSGAAEAACYCLFGTFVSRDILGVATALWRVLTYYVQLTVGAVLFWLLRGRPAA